MARSVNLRCLYEAVRNGFEEVLRIIRLNVFTRKGMISPHRLLVKCSSFKFRYVGIRPPVKNMVNIIIIISGFLNNKSLRDNT